MTPSSHLAAAKRTAVGILLVLGAGAAIGADVAAHKVVHVRTAAVFGPVLALGLYLMIPGYTKAGVTFIVAAVRDVLAAWRGTGGGGAPPPGGVGP